MATERRPTKHDEAGRRLLRPGALDWNEPLSNWDDDDDSTWSPEEDDHD